MELNEQTLEEILTRQRKEYQVLVDDPKTFTKSWTQTYLFDRRDDLKPVENVCDNTRDKP